MNAVTRLVTLVELADGDDDPDPRRLSFSARHEAELADGRRVPLLNGRGWSAGRNRVPADASSGGAHRTAIWAVTSLDDIERTARTVVGPDEPFGGRTQEAMAAAHWAGLSVSLRRHGVDADARELAQLPHDVTCGDRVVACVTRTPGSAGAP